MEIYYFNFLCVRKDEVCEEKFFYYGLLVDSIILNFLVD